ncbi:protein of unknown function (DUF4380) [Prauserella sp. Am3]|nr:protein of unknown function (DUF4380) [Prauserella sp. Am3]
MSAADLVRRGAHDVLWMDNGLVRLGLAPALGGRLLSLRASGPGGYGPELLWRNDALLTDELAPRDGHQPRPHSGALGDWVNYGGEKTWPAPQGWDGPGQWAGPPDPVLDSGRYTATVEDPGAGGCGAVTMTSGDDPRTGLRLTRRYELDRSAASYRLQLTATNTADSTVRWSLWNVTQLAGGGSGGTFVAGPAEVSPLLAGTGFPEWESVDGGVWIPHQDVVGKLGFPTASGILTHTGPDATLTQRFTVDDGACYPDRGARVEVWLEHPLPRPLAELGDLDPPARIVECEVLGPLTTLEPGASTSLTIDCDITVEDR